MKYHLPIKLPHALLLVFALLTGCATLPNQLGIAQADWDQYSPAKQQQLLDDYEKAQAQKKEAHAHAGAAGNGVLSVKIEGGKALLPPYTNLVAYQPLTFTIKQGDCGRKISIMSTDADNPDKGKLEACYQGNTLYLDPSPYNADLAVGSLQFPYMPIWKRGFTYPNVTSTGLIKLTNAQISLRELVPADGN